MKEIFIAGGVVVAVLVLTLFVVGMTEKREPDSKGGGQDEKDIH